MFFKEVMMHFFRLKKEQDLFEMEMFSNIYSKCKCKYAKYKQNIAPNLLNSSVCFWIKVQVIVFLYCSVILLYS